MGEFIQVGFIAARDPVTKEFLPALPIFEERTPEHAEAERLAYKDAGRLFARKFKQYIDGVKAAEKESQK